MHRFLPRSAAVGRPWQRVVGRLGVQPALTRVLPSGCRWGSSSSAAPPLRKTALWDLHRAHGGKMVGFAGWSMPVQYLDQTISGSHLWTREKASVFDVSHMLQTHWTGADHVAFLERLVVADLRELPLGHSQLSVMTNAHGGIVDDTILNKYSSDAVYMVTNAGCADKDIAHMEATLAKARQEGMDVQYRVIDRSLVALQGPASMAVLQGLVGADVDLAAMPFMTAQPMTVAGHACYVTRGGYTGEDGFELSVDHAAAAPLVEALLAHPDTVRLAGLGARDSLRLEAGLCLYGHDLSDATTPVAAGLAWTIGARRRREGGFLGADAVLAQLGAPGAATVAARRVGLIVDGAPAREGAVVYAAPPAGEPFDPLHPGESIGHVTSGCPSPCLRQNIAMAYVRRGHHKIGTTVYVKVRTRFQKATVSKMPFVPTRYHRV